MLPVEISRCRIDPQKSAAGVGDEELLLPARKFPNHGRSIRVQRVRNRVLPLRLTRCRIQTYEAVLPPRLLLRRERLPVLLQQEFRTHEHHPIGHHRGRSRTVLVNVIRNACPLPLHLPTVVQRHCLNVIATGPRHIDPLIIDERGRGSEAVEFVLLVLAEAHLMAPPLGPVRRIESDHRPLARARLGSHHHQVSPNHRRRPARSQLDLPERALVINLRRKPLGFSHTRSIRPPKLIPFRTNGTRQKRQQGETRNQFHKSRIQKTRPTRPKPASLSSNADHPFHPSQNLNVHHNSAP